MEAQFVHLRLHTEYALVDSVISVKSLFRRVTELGMHAVAVTDHTNLFAAIKVYKAALAGGIKPIFGCDLMYLHPEFNKPCGFTLLCLNRNGYRQLSELISKAYISSVRDNGIPYIQLEWLTPEASGDLLMLSGGIEGDIGQLLLFNAEAAQTQLQDWQKIFPNRFYIELQRIGRAGEDAYIHAAVKLASQYAVPVVATHSVRFLEPENFNIHEIRVAIYNGYVLDDKKRPKQYTREQYLTSANNMREHFSDIPEAIDNTIEIAKRCNVMFDLDQAYLPKFPIPKGASVTAYFKQMAHKGLVKRMPRIVANTKRQSSTANLHETYQARLDLELDVIIEMGFAGYFLIVADFIEWAKHNRIPVGPGRGSGAGSLVAYALRITDLDPLSYDLLFERFLNPERVSMPDFDIDFCMDGRDRVIEYVTQKYGRNAVSQIITFGSMAAKAVVRDVGRATGYTYGFVDSIAKLIPFDLGMTLAKALVEEPQLRMRYQSEEEVTALIDVALKLEGTVRNASKHAGGVVIAPTKLTDFTPVYCEEGTQQLVTQYDKDDIEAIGLVKFDFLGLRNLTIIDNALKTVNIMHPKQGEPDLKVDDIPLDDAHTFALLRAANTTAVFQLESRGMKDLIKRQHPDCFEDIIALVALFRPGPLQSGMVDDFINRKHGRARVVYPHPLTQSILKSTYGIILYQEQVMQIAQVLAGYTLGKADLLRRAMGKKKPEEMSKQRKIFVNGAVKKGIKRDTATHIFDLIEKFAGYGFNKSHSAAYAYVSYQTAWLKAHYPAAFMAAALSSDMDNTNKIVTFVADSVMQQVNIELPDINTSRLRFSVAADNSIRYGLGAIKGVGEAALHAIISEREAKGVFADLFEFCRRVDMRKVNKRVIEALIYSGAMDKIGSNRATLIVALSKAMQSAEQQAHNHSFGQHDLFSEMLTAGHSQHDDVYAEVRVKPMSVQEKLLREKSVLGFFLSGHPMNDFSADFKKMKIRKISDLLPTKRNETRTFAGIIVVKRRLKTKRGDIMLIVNIDDGERQIDVTIFSEQAMQYQKILDIDRIIVVEAEISHDTFNGNLRAVAKKITTIDEIRSQSIRAVCLTLSGQRVDECLWQQMHDIMVRYKGECPIELIYRNESAQAKVRLGDEWKILPVEQCMSALSELCDSANVEYK